MFGDLNPSINGYTTICPKSNDLITQKMKVSIKDFFSKYDQIRRKLRIWSHLLKKILNEKLHFLCSARTTNVTINLKKCPINSSISMLNFKIMSCLTYKKKC